MGADGTTCGRVDWIGHKKGSDLVAGYCENLAGRDYGRIKQALLIVLDPGSRLQIAMT